MQLFVTFLIFKADLVEVAGRPALAAAALDAALGLVGWQIVGRHVVFVVDVPSDDGALWIAVQERDDHFLANAWQVLRTPPGPGPRLRQRTQHDDFSLQLPRRSQSN